MSRELWEKVDTRALKPGDVVVNYAGENAVWDAGDSQIVNDNPAGPWHIPCLFRRIPDTEDPQVLRRALEMTSAQVFSAVRAMMDRGGPHPTRENIEHYVQSAIEKARRELESEAGNERRK